MISLLTRLISMALLSGEAIRDQRTGQVMLLPAAAAALAGAVLRTVCGAGLMEMLQSAAPGLGMLIISAATKEAVGYGDGWILISLGLLNGGYDTLRMLTAALMMLSAALIPAARDPFKKNERLPFVPFMAAAYGVVIAT